MRRPTDNHGHARTGAGARSRAAFTLMELLVVIAIMAIISTIAVGGYFGLMRAASYSAAHDNVYNTIALARQRAVIDGKVTSFMVLSATNYVVVRAAGRISHIDKGVAHDAYSDLSGALSQGSEEKDRIEIYNLDAQAAKAGRFKRVLVRRAQLSLEDPTLPATDPARWYELPGFVFDGAGNDFFAIGDRYGFALHARQALPQGYLFKDYPTEVRFDNDGSCSEEITVTVEETIRKENKILIKIKTTGELDDTGSKVKK